MIQTFFVPAKEHGIICRLDKIMERALEKYFPDIYLKTKGKATVLALVCPRLQEDLYSIIFKNNYQN